MNYARRQQYRRLSRAGRLALAGLTVALLAMLLLSIGFALPGGLLLALAVTIGFRARHWMSLAGRSRVGAHSEDEVRRALAALEQHGWRLRHALRWQGGGDIDSVAIAPNGVGFAIGTKTRRYDERQLGRVLEQASWLGRCRPRWCSRRALPVLWVVRAAGVARYERGVLVVSASSAAQTAADADLHRPRLLPDPSLGPHDPTTAVELAALLIKDKGAPSGQAIDAYLPYVRAYNGSGPMADAYAARVLADAHAYQGAGALVVAGCAAAAGTYVNPFSGEAWAPSRVSRRRPPSSSW